MCESDARTAQYELIVRKRAEHLVTLEGEHNFLSKESNRAKLPKIIIYINLTDLNKCGLCTVTGNYQFVSLFYKMLKNNFLFALLVVTSGATI